MFKSFINFFYQIALLHMYSRSLDFLRYSPRVLRHKYFKIIFLLHNWKISWKSDFSRERIYCFSNMFTFFYYSLDSIKLKVVYFLVLFLFLYGYGFTRKWEDMEINENYGFVRKLCFENLTGTCSCKCKNAKISCEWG